MATQVAFSDLDSWLQSQPANTPDTPYEITITRLTTSNYNNIKTALTSNSTKYVDLSTTSIPNGVTSMESTFYNCTSLVNAPVIPEGVTNMKYTFYNCRTLVNAPVIPDSVINMHHTFYICTSLVNAPVIPEGVTSMESTFYNCTSLVNAPVIPEGVTNMNYTFYNCTSLVNAPVIPEGVTNMNYTFYNCRTLSHKPIAPSTLIEDTNCFNNVTTPNWKGTRSQVNNFISTDDCEIQVYNDDRVTLEDTIYNVDISTLSTYLAGLDPNTVSTAYKVYIRGLTSSNASDIKTALIAGNKYVDLSYTTIPNGTNMENLFYDVRMGCLLLVVPPNLPTDQTSLYRTFSRCYNLREAPAIPNSYTNLSIAFSFTSITQMPELPSNVTNISNAFSNTLLTTPKEIPNSVTDMSFAFSECLNLEYFPNIPSGVTNGKGAFSGCTSLRKIEEFNIPLNTLKNNTNFQNMFVGCTSLESIGFKIDTDTWHAWRLKFDANSVEGKIFGFNNGQLTSTAVLNTQINKNDIRLPVLTDELWFPPANMSDSDVEDVIRSVLNNRYTYWNKAVINPNSKSLVMMASDPNNVVSNFLNGGGGGGVEKLVISTTRSVNVTKDTRIFADGSAITITLNYGSSAEGYVAEVYAIQACTITYYTAQGTTTSLAMEAGGKAIFVYFSGWKLHSNYGTTNSVAVDNMQSVSSNAVAQALTGYITTDFLSRYLIQKTTFYLTDNGTSTFNIPNNECYLFMNIHALVNPQICLVRLYQGVLRVSTIMTGANNVAITYVSGSTVQFKATGNCRGYLWKFNGAGTT